MRNENNRKRARKECAFLSGFVLVIHVQSRLDGGEFALVDQTSRGQRIAMKEVTAYKRENKTWLGTHVRTKQSILVSSDCKHGMCRQHKPFSTQTNSCVGWTAKERSQPASSHHAGKLALTLVPPVTEVHQTLLARPGPLLPPVTSLLWVTGISCQRPGWSHTLPYSID